MNKFCVRALFVAAIVMHCGSAHAGWFDNKKQAKTQAKPTAVAQVQKVTAAVNPAPQRIAPAVPVRAVAAAPSFQSQGQAKFIDIGVSGAKTDEESARENAERDKNRVRLSNEEMKKMKAEMEKLQQGIKVVRDAREATDAINGAAAKPVSIPVIPQKPVVLPVVPQVIPSAAAKPASFKAINSATTAAGYKK